MRPMICAYEGCNEIIEGKGSILEGKAYHTECLHEAEFFVRQRGNASLIKAFHGIDNEALEDLFEQYVIDQGKMTLEELEKALKSKWVIITRGLNSNCNGEIQFDTFPSKTKTCNWMADQIQTGLIEGYVFEIEYILNNGQIVSGNNEYEVKIRF